MQAGAPVFLALAPGRFLDVKDAVSPGDFAENVLVAAGQFVVPGRGAESDDRPAERHVGPDARKNAARACRPSRWASVSTSGPAAALPPSINAL